MKRKMIILLGSLSLILGGTSGVVKVNPSSNTSQTTCDQTGSNAAVQNLRFSRTKLLSNTASEGGFNFTNLVISGIEKGGANLIGSALGSLGTLAFNSLLSSMGVDMRSVTDKKLDQITDQINTLQQNLQQGLIDVKRKMEHLHNEDVMEKLLNKLSSIQTPITSKLTTLADLARKEVIGYDKNALAAEKEVFYKSLGDLKFTCLEANNLWNSAENLAKSILIPYNTDQTLTLSKLYEETYGLGETWDYATIEPRVRFMGYIGTLVNSLTQLAQVRACYEMSKYKPGDSILLDYETGVKAMIVAANQVNGKFKEALDRLSLIKQKHDEQHLITHREAVVDKDGGLSFKDGKTVSTRLFVTSTADNDTNYLCYKHNEKNRFVRYDTGAGGTVPVYANFVYTLNCDQMDDLYKAVLDEYAAFNGAAAAKVSVQDYLLKVGFYCNEKANFNDAKGFFKNITNNTCKGSRDDFWRTDTHNQLNVHYYDFNTCKEQTATYSDVNYYSGGWFSKGTYSGGATSQTTNNYIVFLNADQETIEGKTVKTDVQQILRSDTGHGEYYNKHYKGFKDYPGTDTIKIN